MSGTSCPSSVSTKLQRIAELARRAPQMVFTTLAHHIDVEFLREAYRRTRKNGAVGVDLQSADEYASRLESNLQALLDQELTRIGVVHVRSVAITPDQLLLIGTSL